MPLRGHARRPLADQQPVRGDPGEQGVVAGRVRAVDPARQDGEGRRHRRRAHRGARPRRCRTRRRRRPSSPRSASWWPSSAATCSPYAVAARDPTRATERSVNSSSRGVPRTQSASGGISASVRFVWSFRSSGSSAAAEGQRVHGPGRPLVVLGHDQPRAAPLGRPQVVQRAVDLAPRADEPLQPLPGGAGAQPPGRLDRPDVVDETPEVDAAPARRPG